MAKSGVEHLAQHPGWKTKKRGRRVTGKATLSFYENGAHRMYGEPYQASVLESMTVFHRLLEQLVLKGVVPGKKLRITIEELL